MGDATPDITARAIKMAAQHEQPSTDGDERFEVASVLRELVAEVDRLRSENARLDGVTKGLAGSHASLRAEVERMRVSRAAARDTKPIHRRTT